MALNRRQFITAGLGLAAGSALTGAWPISALAAPKPKVRQFNFTAQKAKVSLGTGREFTALTFNGQAPGPEIRVKQGEIIRVVLQNDLDEPTTIHWHGIPLDNPMDGVPGLTQEPIPPGGRFVYEFEAQPAGTFIYHSHLGYQMDQGLHGALIIEPKQEERAYDQEYALVLEDWVLADGGGPAATRRRPPMGRGMMGRGMTGRGSTGAGGGPLLEPAYDAYAVSGLVYPATKPIKVKKGDRIKLRIANASSSTIYDLRLAGHALTITHADGNSVQPITTDVLRIGMGERYDVEFTADNPGKWFLMAYDTGLGESGLKVPVVYQGVQRAAPTPPIFQRDVRYAGYADLQALRPGPHAPGAPDRIYGQTLGGGMHSPYWTINGRVHPDSQPLAVGKGQRIRLSYFNRSMMAHPMHLHGHFFRVVNPSLAPENWIEKDTVIVDRMQRLDIEFLADNPGQWFHHCHNLYHMEAGMANVVSYQ